MPTALIVEDSAIVRRVARRILEDHDFVVAEAEDGTAALEACGRTMPDFVLLDWRLPLMDGLDFLKAMRALGDGDRPKVVYCTSEADVADIARALRAGADEYLLKPFDRDLFTTKLQDVGVL